MNPPIGSVAGQHIVVVGGTRGIGRALCQRLLESGARVTLTGRDSNHAAHVADELAANRDTAQVRGAAFDGSAADIEASAAALFDATVPDGLIVNAGTSPLYTRPEKIPLETWNEIIAVNLTAPFVLATAYARQLISTKRRGSIVFVSSIAGLRGTQRLTAYGASKAGLDGLTRHLAIEWAEHGIRVNSVAPGWVNTDMTAGLHQHEVIAQQLLDTVPLGWIAKPEDVVDVMVFLVSDSARFVTGATYSVDGGTAAR